VRGWPTLRFMQMHEPDDLPTERLSPAEIAEVARMAGKRREPPPPPPGRRPAELRITFRPPTAPPIAAEPAEVSPTPPRIGRTAWTFAAGLAAGLSVFAAYALL
jgi:hypothetical protein